MPDLDKNYYLDREGLNTLIREFEANIIAYEYNPTVTYSKLDYCIHDNKFYQCFVDTTTGTWNEDDWTIVAIGDVLNKVRQENLTATGSRPVLLGTSSSNPRLITTYKSNRLTFSNGDEDTSGLLTVYGSASFRDEVITASRIYINDPVGHITGVSNLDTWQINGVTVGSTPKFTDTTYTFTGGTNSFTVTPEGGTAQTVSVTPSIANNITGSGTSGKVAAFTGANTIGDGYSVDTTVTSGSSNLVTSGAVYTAIDNLPEPMVFKGTLGTGGTITTLPTASSSNEGFTYKVITAGTYASQSAKVGDVFVSNGSAWVLIPSGDTDSDTWRNIKVNGTELLGSAISTGAINFKSGTNTTVSGSGNDITISSTDTNTTYSLTQDASDGHKITLTPSSGTAQTVTIPDNNTTYTFANGTNGFTVTPSGGTAQTVTVTPSITNNVTGSGTSGYIAKFNGAHTITNAVALGSDTTKYLRNDGTWEVPTGTTYSQGTGISISGTTINHSNSVTAGTAGTSSATSGSTLAVPYVTYDAQGHVTASGTHTHTVTGFATTDTKNTAGATDTSSKIFLVGALEQTANPQTYSDDQVYVTNGTLTAGNTQATVLGVVPTNGTSGGISLYGGTGQVDNYGIAFRTTANKGKHGDIQGDWATYFTMNDADNRGWIFRRNGGAGNVASVSTQGNAVFNGSVTVGGNTTNTSGARIVYSASEQAINFEFL